MVVAIFSCPLLIVLLLAQKYRICKSDGFTRYTGFIHLHFLHLPLESTWAWQQQVAVGLRGYPRACKISSLGGGRASHGVTQDICRRDECFLQVAASFPRQDTRSVGSRVSSHGSWLCEAPVRSASLAYGSRGTPGRGTGGTVRSATLGDPLESTPILARLKPCRLATTPATASSRGT